MGLQAFGLEAPFLLRVGAGGVGCGVGFGGYRTLVQSERCASVSFCLFWDTRAVLFLRACLILLTFGPACSWRAACVSDFACFGTLVQYCFCVRVSGWRLLDTCAVSVLH